MFQNVKFTGTLTLPESITEIGQGAFSNTGFTDELNFGELYNLTKIGSNTFNGVSFDGTLSVPPNLAVIEASSFRNTSITKLDLSNALSLTTIKESAFAGTNIEEIVFNYDESVLETLGVSSFSGANITGYLALPQGIVSIGSSLFNSNNNMTGLYIPSSVTSLGGKVIGNKTPFTYDFQSLAANPEWGSNWYYPGTSTQQGQEINFGVSPPY